MKTHHLLVSKVKYIVFLQIFHFQVAYGQMPPCVDNTPPGESACLVTPICEFNGYCGRTVAAPVDAWNELKLAIKNATIDAWGIDYLTLENDK
jgi:hypothetical protein